MNKKLIKKYYNPASHIYPENVHYVHKKKQTWDLTWKEVICVFSPNVIGGKNIYIKRAAAATSSLLNLLTNIFGFLITQTQQVKYMLNKSPFFSVNIFLKEHQVDWSTSLCLYIFSIHTSWMLKNSPTPWCSHLQTSLLPWWFWGNLSTNHVVYCSFKRVQL